MLLDLRAGVWGQSPLGNFLNSKVSEMDSGAI